MLLDSLADRLSTDSVRELLSRAGETRSLEELSASATWSSYEEFRRLLEAAKRASDLGPDGGRHNRRPRITLDTEIAGTIQAFGSPAAVLATNTGTNPLLPIRLYETTEVGPNEWTIREWFIDGFDPYPEFCEFVAEQFRMIPLFFGLPEADVSEEECQCRGDGACLYRMRWADLDEATSRAEYLEVRNEHLEARLEQLQEMITDLASNERYEDVLQGIVSSTMSAVFATEVVLALDPRIGHSRKIYSQGLTETEAGKIADDLLRGDRNGVRVVEVASVRQHYGVLGIGDHGGLFRSQLQNTLETHARLAAATLDAAAALEEARHQATSAQALLELSRSLAEIVSTEEMAQKVVLAVPDVIDCDRVLLLLDDGSQLDPGDRSFKVMACFGYTAEVAASLNGRVFLGSEVGMDSEYGLVERVNSSVGHVATVSAPITVGGETIGFIVVSVATDPERLAVTPRLADRLKGLAAQAAIAINNSRLVDQIRYQAVHDTLTGLPNRALILDRLEQMLARARRNEVPVAVLFVDLDGFKFVNDTFGHGIGDQLLRAVADRLTLVMREGDSIGRIGGDEFIVLVDGSTTDLGPELVAERLLTSLHSPFEIDGKAKRSLELTASIGIAAGPRPSATELLRDADIALYRAKDMGKDCFVVFRPEMHLYDEMHLSLQDLAIPKRAPIDGEGLN